MNNENTQNGNIALDDDTLRDRFLSFNIANEVYAFPIKYVTEIIGTQYVTEVPNIKEYIIGIINLRGIIVPVIDIRIRFNMPKIEYTDRSCIIVIRINNYDVGLLVDGVSEVVVLKNEIMSLPPKTNKRTQSRFIKSIAKLGKDVKIILDMNKLLYDHENTLLEQELSEN